MVKATDPATLQVTIGPNHAPSLVLALLSSIVGSVVEKSAALAHERNRDLGNGWLKTHAAGSGPFALRAWKANESVMIRHVPEPAAQRRLVEKGDADIARDLAPDQVASLAADKDVTITTSPQATLHDLVDYDGMANSSLKGQDQAHQTFWPSGFQAALDKAPFTFDPAKAKRLLAEAGHPNGFALTLDASNTAPYSTMAQSIQSSIAQGSVRVTIVPGEQKTVITKYRARQHQMPLIYWGPDYWTRIPTPTASRATPTTPTTPPPSRSPGTTPG